MERPDASMPPTFHLSVTVSVTDPDALWGAAATHLLSYPMMTADDVVDTLGPANDPDLAGCLVAIVSQPDVLGSHAEEITTEAYSRS